MCRSCHRINKGVSLSELPRDRELLPPFPQGKQVARVSESSRVLPLALAGRENMGMNNYCGFAGRPLTTLPSWPDSNESWVLIFTCRVSSEWFCYLDQTGFSGIRSNLSAEIISSTSIGANHLKQSRGWDFCLISLCNEMQLSVNGGAGNVWIIIWVYFATANRITGTGEHSCLCSLSAESFGGSLFAWGAEVSLWRSDHVVKVLYWWKNLLRNKDYPKPASGSYEFSH